MLDAIIAKNVSKKFRQASSTTLKTFLLRDLWKRDVPQKAFWALKDISISVKKGSTFGIIGQNGSGKSTLLKIVAGILAPDAGGCSVNGRISALIELGAGFHPDFSGRENIYINGMLLGLSKKTIHKKMDEIIEFSELRDFIDEPVRTYSSGMYSRLGFSVAVSVDPDVLLIDEVFAVGDEGFVHKCKSKMNEFKKKGKTILFVTHDLGTVENWCDEAMWLDSGVMGVAGPVSRTVDAYRRSVRLKE
ncbi:MAG: ABC transporter ATP-binding protein, partial [Deltaproteobacteria bacterium]